MAKVYFSTGNKKLLPSDDTNFLIFNIPARVTCPYATALCKKYCYAVKAETVYPDVLPSRQRNFEASKQADFVDVVSGMIKAKKARQRKKILW